MRGVAAVSLVLILGAACAESARTSSGAPLPTGDATIEPTDTPTPQPSATPTTEPSPSPTAPPVRRLRFVAIGDYGSGLTPQLELADRMCRFHQRKPFDLVVTTGDNVYESGDPTRFGEVFFRPYDCLLDAGVRFRATLGNHDIVTGNGRPELNEPAFGFRGRNYVVRRDGVRLVMTDSNALRMDWLRTALRPEEGDRWTIVVFHHPVYSSGEHGSTPGLAEQLVPLFRRRGVDLVLNGHDHNYEASKPLGGIRYVVTGGGGASMRPCGAPLPTTAICIARYHFLEIEAGPNRIEVRAIPRRGRPFHTFTTMGRA
ncbi:MAG: metallophosphoesterase [Actinomycetota bacterium]